MDILNICTFLSVGRASRFFWESHILSNIHICRQSGPLTQSFCHMNKVTVYIVQLMASKPKNRNIMCELYVRQAS